jgi:hypothetical protein
MVGSLSRRPAQAARAPLICLNIGDRCQAILKMELPKMVILLRLALK